MSILQETSASSVSTASSASSASTEECGWIPVCGYADLLPERGAAVLVGGHQVAVFRTFEGDVHAIGNHDPYSGAFVLSRGIVGTRGGEPTVASPMHKQVFSLVTGTCLDDPATAVPVYPIRVTAGTVEVSVV